MYKDYFGNPIKEGDVILRPYLGGIMCIQVLKINEKTFCAKRQKWQNTGWSYNPNTKSYNDLSKKPLYISVYNLRTCINLTNLDLNLIQNCIDAEIERNREL